jgi:hypothetical protein
MSDERGISLFTSRAIVSNKGVEEILFAFHTRLFEVTSAGCVGSEKTFIIFSFKRIKFTFFENESPQKLFFFFLVKTQRNTETPHNRENKTQ